MNCTYDGTTPAVRHCAGCNVPLCSSCGFLVREALCNSCYDKVSLAHGSSFLYREHLESVRISALHPVLRNMLTDGKGERQYGSKECPHIACDGAEMCIFLNPWGGILQSLRDDTEWTQRQ